MKLVFPTFLPEPEIRRIFFEFGFIQMPVKKFKEEDI